MIQQKTRYAVVGLGHISQVAALPGFKNTKNSEVTALVSGDPSKLKVLSKKYGIKNNTYSYEEYDKCLKSGEIDAVYIALPNRLHRDYAIRAAEAGIHVLCEKPLAVTSQDCQAMIKTALENKVKLMVAYRLHFDPGTLKAIEIVHSGKIGKLKYFTSEFGYELKSDNIRALPQESGGPLHDIGIYCINASRYLFKTEPIEVFAYGTSLKRGKLPIHETISTLLKFPDDKLATFVCSFDSGVISTCRVVGQFGDLFLENAYEYVGELQAHLTVREKTKTWKSKIGDQFAAELQYFSNCIQNNQNPEPSGLEGLIDVQIIEALYQSIKTGKAIPLKTLRIQKRPSALQKIKRPAHRKPDLYKVEAAPK